MNLLRRFTGTAVILFALSVPCCFAAEGTKPSPEKEAELVALLKSDSPKADKAIACKQLAIHGSDSAVPELAKLLPDEQLSSWARIALEAIPGTAADEALRKATETLEGKLLIGTLNTIGVRRDAGAVELLTGRLKDKDADVASAAAVALGRVANEAATKTLRAALASAPENVRSAVAEGCVLCAEHNLAHKKIDEAIAIYDEIRKADVPKQRIVEATRGAILARKDEGIPLLLENLKLDDKPLFNVALQTARELPGNKIDAALAAELEGAVPSRAALIIATMADRPQTVQLPAVLKAATKGNKAVRLAAISALARVGNETCVSPLLEIAVDDDKEVAAAAKAALGELPGEKVNGGILTLLAAKGEGKAYPILIEVVGQRRITATSALLKALDSTDKEVRTAALVSLGETVDPKNLNVLINLVLSSKGDDAAIAQKALKTACVRMPDREECAAELAGSFSKASTAVKNVFLDILGAMGGNKALETIHAAAKSKEDALQDTSTKLLGLWLQEQEGVVPPGLESALTDLAKTLPAGDKYQTRAVSAYIRIARQFKLADDQRAELFQKAYDIANRTNEKKAIVETLKRFPNASNLKLAIKAAQVSDLKDEAAQSALVIAQKMNVKPAELKEILSKIQLEKVKLEIVKAEFGAGAKQKDVTDIIKKQAGDVTLIPLPADDYNTSFGGDPAPDTVKQLKIQYKLNGKAGEATFAENALIVLPTPK